MAQAKEKNRRPQIRLGLIGAGEVVRTIHLPVLQAIPNVKIRWVMDVDRMKAQGLARNYGIPVGHASLEDCEEVDAVLMAIPVGGRVHAWNHAFKRRWHVLCEKPVARTVAEFDWIIENMRRNGRAMSPGLMRRFYANTMLLRDLVDSAVFGELIEVWAGEGVQMTRTGRGTNWYQLDKDVAGGGILIETGAHLLDQIMFICHAEDVCVDCYDQAPSRRSMEFKAKVDGRLTTRLNRELPFTCSLSRADDLCNGIFLRFSRLVLRMDHGPEGGVHICDTQGKAVSSLSTVNHGAVGSLQAFHAEWRSFLEKCGNLADPKATLEHRLTRLSIRIIEDCYSKLH